MKDLRTWLLSMVVTSVVLAAWCANSRAEDIPPLTKNNGPFMVVAGSFRGPEAERLARALALELRKNHDLPAFLYQRPDVMVEKTPEFAIMVGNAKTNLENKVLQQRIKKIKPDCFATSAIEKAGLTKAFCTTNPFL